MADRAAAVAEGYADADGGKGIGLADAMNVALAAVYRTEVMFTTGRVAVTSTFAADASRESPPGVPGKPLPEPW